MNRDNAEHFYTWLEAHVAEDEQHTVEQQIHTLLEAHPDLVLNHSWPEMRILAERS